MRRKKYTKHRENKYKIIEREKQLTHYFTLNHSYTLYIIYLYINTESI